MHRAPPPRFTRRMASCGKNQNMQRQQKITLGEMRANCGPTRLLIYCSDHKCSHLVMIDAACWPDDLRLSDLEDRFVCEICGRRGADVRPLSL